MKNPQRITTVRTEIIGDGLGVHDAQTGKTYVLNATTALVWQHCDGNTTSRQLTEHLQRQFNLPQRQADGLLQLALGELREADLLEAGFARPSNLERRQLLKSLAAAGLALVLLPVVASAVASTKAAISDDPRDGDDDDDDHDHDHDDHHHHHHHHTTTTTPPPTTTTVPPTTTTVSTST